MGVRIEQTRNGKWRIKICHKRRRKQRTVSDRKTAFELVRRLEMQLALGDVGIGNPDSPTLQEYAAVWLRTHAMVYTKPRTVEYYQTMLRRHIVPTLGGLRLSELSRERVKALVADRAASGLARGTLDGIVASLRVICNHAIEEGRMTQNPAARLGRFYRGLTEKEGRQVDAFTERELALVLKTAERECPEQSDLISTAGLTGMRVGEVLGLQWPDIDFEGRFIEVRRTVYWRGTGLHVSSPKSGKGRRVAIPRLLAKQLRQRRDLLTAHAALEGREPSVWAFPNRAGKPQDSVNLLKRTWYPLLAKAGLRRLSFHALRHTYSSLLIQRGESLAFIKQQLGHASIQTTVDVYGHLVPGDNRECLDRLADATGRNNPQHTQQAGSWKISQPLDLAGAGGES